MRKYKKNKSYILTVTVITFFVFIIVLAYVFSSKQTNTVNFDVGDPGAGTKAPNIILPATDGSTFDLSSLRGETVLLYFQEGIMCQACWAQLGDIEKNFNLFENIGVDQIVTITTDPINPLKEMVQMNQFQSLVLSDNDVVVSAEYNTNLYGMPGMGSNYNGHTFILVNEEGTILWRADYGRYTMYVPIETLVEELKMVLE